MAKISKIDLIERFVSNHAPKESLTEKFSQLMGKIFSDEDILDLITFALQRRKQDVEKKNG